jgi:glycine/D-amino acid oxidase-like deaminating enzyme
MTIRKQTSSTWPWGDDPPANWHRAAYADAATVPFWLDTEERPDPLPPLRADERADLVVVGGGLSGLWAAVLAKQRDPDRDVVLVEGGRIAGAASGRNGGFLSYSLTHGVGNGMSRFPEEMPQLERLGLRNFDAIVGTIREHGIECGLELTGHMDIALEPHEEEWLAEEVEALRQFGHDVELLDGEAMRAEVASPLFRSGLWLRSGSAMVDPARLCWGLQRIALEAGVRIYEGTPVRSLDREPGRVALRCDGGRVEAQRVLLATSAFRGLVPAIRARVVPVYDYVLVTEPLGAEARKALRWERRQGLSDVANQFHYYRLTADDRILWGGYDAVYDFGGRVSPSRYHRRDESFAKLAMHFFRTFPQLEGVRFTHRWGGAIDTCSRFFAFYGTALDGRVAYNVGHTGLGVGASRFGAELALDLLDGRDSEALRLRAFRSKPIPFPPEPLRWAVIQLTRDRLDAADRNQGRRGLWLRTLDRLGLGFDS